MRVFIFMIFLKSMITAYEQPWNPNYEELLIKRAAEKILDLSRYPSLIYPNENYKDIVKLFPQEKILIFTYGSLMNVESALRTINYESISTIEPAIAFGFKRVFNYKSTNPSRWGNLGINEKAMLNIEPTTTYHHIINGALIKVDAVELRKLIEREKGYDLVPMLVANWDAALSESPSIEIRVAYTFLVFNELREGISYIEANYYPVRGYLHAVQNGAASFGPKFLCFWNSTTYLSDGITSMNEWESLNFLKK